VDTSRVGAGEAIAGASGVVLLISLFLPWYGVDLEVAGASIGGDVNAWEAMGFIDILLLLVAVVAIAVPLARVAGALPEDIPAGLAVLVTGGFGLLLVVFRLIDVPGPDVRAIAGDTIDVGRKAGVLVALVATAGMTYGGWRASGEAEPGATTPAAAPPPSPTTSA
jgi:hypothetical protein